MIKIVFLIMIIIMSSIATNAQTDPGTDPDVPIDGGISLLLAAGVGFGIKELRKKRNNHSENP